MYKLPSFEFTEFLAFLCFYFQSTEMFVEMFSEVIIVFSQFRGNTLKRSYNWPLFKTIFPNKR